MMKQFYLILSLVFILLSAPGLAAAEPNMQEGQWEITTTVDMPGMPAAMPAMKHTQCITKNDLVPRSQTQQQNQECTVTDTKTSGNTVTWAMKCKTGGSDMTGKGSITYSGDTFDGTFNMNMQGGMKMTQKMKGRRLGACK
ncbi:MAG: DUF3617 family protein [Deltaproteobacteria bacterium]|nr:DUF3617 family protein [Deltaproteobacteria bacterium]